MPFAVNANTFAKCAPNISTNIKNCGSVTICSAKPLTSDELASVYMKSTDYRVMEALFHHDMEIKMCEAVQDGLYEFFMANKVAVHRRQQTTREDSGLIRVAPFIMARQYSPINNEWWRISGGVASGNNWQVTATSTTNIPADTRSFPVGLRVFTEAVSGGIKITGAYVIVSAVDNGNNTLTLVMSPQNSASLLDANKVGNPTSGLLKRGTANVNSYESYCPEMPAYLNWKNVPFWVEETRDAMCYSSQYDKWRKLLLEDNPLYREFGDLSEIEKNKQLALDWQKRIVNQMWFGTPRPHQTMADYDLLDDIPAYAGLLDSGGNQVLGVDGSTCVGKRADAIGIYNQMAECGRVADLTNVALNLPDLFVELYNMMRVREGRGNKNAKMFDLFTDSVYAELINQAMITYYLQKGQNAVRLVKSIDPGNGRDIKQANFGFNYESYKLFWPQGVVINVVTHNFFDDYVAAGQSVSAAMGAAATVLWVLDFAGIYPGILASERVVHNTGDLATLAKINTSFACVMKVNTRQLTLIAMTWTMIIECPAANLILENIARTVPTNNNASTPGLYPGTHTSTSTSTGTPFIG